MKEITVSKDVWDTMVYLYFGATDNYYKAASARAYLDFCRTIKFTASSNEEERAQARTDVDGMIENKFKAIANGAITSQDKYDEWHEKLCDEIVVRYAKVCGDQFCIGQAQKWVNMTVKYLYLIDGGCVKPITAFAHVPLDNYVFAAAVDHLALSSNGLVPWSKINDYSVYLNYQKGIREAVKDLNTDPLHWELLYWLEEAKTLRRTTL